MTDTPENRVSSLLSVVELVMLTCDDLKAALIELQDEFLALKKENQELKTKLFANSSETVMQISRQSATTFMGKSIE